MLLLAQGLAACSTPATSIGASPSNVPQPSVGAPGMPSQPLALTAAPALPAPLDAPAGSVANKPGWRELGRLASNSTSGPTIAALAFDPITPTTLYAPATNAYTWR